MKRRSQSKEPNREIIDAGPEAADFVSSKELWSLLIEEYKSLRAENLAIQIEYKKIISTTLASIAVLLGLLNYVLKVSGALGSVWLFLISLVYSLLGIYYLRQVWYKDLISIYISTRLKKQFQKLVNASEDAHSKIDLVRWDDWQSRHIYSSHLCDRPMEAATLLIPLLPSLSLSVFGTVQLLTYNRFTANAADFSWRLAGTVLLGCVAIASLLYCCWLAYDLRRRLRDGLSS